MEITVEMIRKCSPCVDPTCYVTEDWSGTLVDILNMNNVPATDRIWAVTHFLDNRTNRLFAVWCVRGLLGLAEDLDPRSAEACNVSEKFANGGATIEELDAAARAALHAFDAARAARAAHSVAHIAYEATYYAIVAASYVADNIAEHASWAAYCAAAYFARLSTEIRKAQIEKLKEMIQ